MFKTSPAYTVCTRLAKRDIPRFYLKTKVAPRCLFNSYIYTQPHVILMEGNVRNHWIGEWLPPVGRS